MRLTITIIIQQATGLEHKGIEVISLVVYTNEPMHAMAFTSLLEPRLNEFAASIVADASSLAAKVAASQPDVILLSVDGPLDWDLLHKLHRESPLSRVVLWLHDIALESAFRAKEYGVRGILRKSLSPDMILKCVQRVYLGELWFEKTLTESFLSGKTVRVTRRENQLITLISQGLKNKEIATVLEISEGTVKVYLSRLFEKVGVRDRFELALLGLRSVPKNGDSEAAAAKSVFLAVAGSGEPLQGGVSSASGPLFSKLD